MIANLPQQRVSLAHKLKEDSQWGKDTMKAYIDGVDWGTNLTSDYQKFYDLYYGRPDTDVYKYVTNPYNFPDWKKFNMPAKVRNYNIIKPVVDLLLGEHLKRPFNYKVVVKNFDAPNKMKEDRMEALKKAYMQIFINEVNATGADTGVPSQEMPKPEEIVKAFNAGYDDFRAMMGQDALDYLMYSLELPDQMQEAFFHWCVTGKVVSFKGVSHNDVDYKVISPDEIYHDMSAGIKYIEDGDYIVRKVSMTANQILDAFYDDLTEKDIDYLENPNSTDIVSAVFGGNNQTLQQTMQVYHVVWKTFRKLGFLKYIDINGLEQEMTVTEGYVKSEDHGDIELEWKWVSDVWEGYRIDQDRYLGIKQTAHARQSMSNPSELKLPYNGRVYAEEFDELVSIVSLGEPFQILYNVFHFMLEKTINKNKDKLALMDINMIPKKAGWDEDKFMYFADAFSYAFIDSTAENAQGDKAHFNNFSVLDMSLSQYIARQFELLISVKQEYEDLIGVTRQRKGNISASDTVGGTERAVFQSAVTSEDHFRRFESFRTREMQGLLDMSQFAWKDGKKGTFLDSDLRNRMLDIDPEDFNNADLGIFGTDSSEEMNRLELLKNVALEFAQNGAEPSTIADILAANNFSKIKANLKATEEARKKHEQNVAQQQAQEQQKLEKMRIENREDEQSHKTEIEDKKLARKDRELDIKEMEITGKQNIESAKVDIAADSNAVSREANKSKEKIEDKKAKASADKKST